MKTDEIQAVITAALEDLKVQDLTVLDVREKTTIADVMLVGSGTSNRHLQALVDRVDDAMSARGMEPLGREGSPGSDWVLIDYGDVIVHVMLPETRAFYDLEQLWSGASPQQAEAGEAVRQDASD